ncbi:MAG TPA: DUF3147 family protein [Candidatus Acidoferrum sp.]|nr:DUF3147 family protein [Candidatus Acidoferrum sp.]
MRGTAADVFAPTLGAKLLIAQLIFRFAVGGLIVSLFAALGDVLKPKSFAGLFGAAPSVALATLSLTIATDGKLYAATEARSMIVGAIAFLVYAAFCSRLMMRNRVHSTSASTSALAVWLICALGLWAIALR